MLALFALCAALPQLAWAAHARNGTYGDPKAKVELQVSHHGREVDTSIRLCRGGTWYIRKALRIKAGRFHYVGPAVVYSPRKRRMITVRIRGRFRTPRLATGTVKGGPCRPLRSRFRARYGTGVG